MAPASCDIGGIAALRKFAALARSADVIHYHFPWPFADVLHLVSGAKKPAILTYHSDIVRQQTLAGLYGPLMRKMLRSMCAIVATSPAYARTSPVLTDAVLQDRVEVIPLGIDEHSYPEGDDGVFSRIGVAAEQPYFLFIGVLRYYKGLHVLVDAASRVNAKIVIAGSGPEREALRARVEQFGCRNVVFAGQVSDAEKVALLKRCRAVVLPSHLRSEAFGMVLVEAAMFGRPMVSCEIGTGTSYVNLHGETGFVVKPEDPAELADAMNLLLGDEVLAGRLGKAARLRYEQSFSGEALGRAYSALYRRVAGL
jgi:rhamnosyl/mannosyltransferase